MERPMDSNEMGNIPSSGGGTVVSQAAQSTSKVSAFPISFSEFVKEPVKGVMFLCLIAVGYLYVDLKLNYNKQIDKQGQKIELLERKVDILTDQLRRSDSMMAAATSKLQLLAELGKMK